MPEPTSRAGDGEVSSQGRADPPASAETEFPEEKHACGWRDTSLWRANDAEKPDAA